MRDRLRSRINHNAVSGESIIFSLLVYVSGKLDDDANVVLDV